MIEQPFLQINAKQLCFKKCGRKEKAYFKLTLPFIPVAKTVNQFS
jgi:hypothetical protein